VTKETRTVTIITIVIVFFLYSASHILFRSDHQETPYNNIDSFFHAPTDRLFNFFAFVFRVAVILFVCLFGFGVLFLAVMAATCSCGKKEKEDYAALVSMKVFCAVLVLFVIPRLITNIAATNEQETQCLIRNLILSYEARVQGVDPILVVTYNVDYNTGEGPLNSTITIPYKIVQPSELFLNQTIGKTTHCFYYTHDPKKIQMDEYGSQNFYTTGLLIVIALVPISLFGARSMTNKIKMDPISA